ncbi:MAG TPA: hypothetical protein VK797_07880 [Tepidisphaeraceae bacterium]|nr:hypothetical protein [Tepidisphaeraceae bacterium]
MRLRQTTQVLLIVRLVSAAMTAQALAQPFDPDLYQSLRWRCIGPFRGGRCVGAVGVPAQPSVFYMGVNNGGVWKTDDYGRTWRALFDEQPTGSIGDVAVCESRPDVIYAGSGEGLQRPDLSVGDGIYKSTDGGKSWANVGLRDAQQIGSVIVDPKDPDRIFVAALGHPFGPNRERGVFRSTDGGKTWQKVLYKNENVGAIQVVFDPHDSQVVYAVLWESRQGPWENGQWQGAGSGLYKSVDGGGNWKQLTRGLPDAQDDLGRIGIGISFSNPQIIYATVDAGSSSGIYRSDDAGENWRLINGTDGRLYGRGSDFAEIKPDPKNPDIVYIANTSTYKSNDGGKTFTAFKGAPGGDDYHRFWINPNNPQIILLASDQGATISVNGGATWSSWYNQPTAQFYHVSTDNQFPYWVYGGQQESGSAAVASRGDYGAITWRDWRTIGVEEYDYAAPDPLDPNIMYGGKVRRFDKRTGQVQDLGPEAGSYRALRTAPVVFSPVDKKTLYFAGNVLFKTVDGGHTWQTISPDLSRPSPAVPESIGVYRTPNLARMPRRGVIYTVAPSFQDVATIWAGTDDGLIHITRDGGRTWSDITPPRLSAWSKVSMLEASHFDNDSAYAAINRLRLDDTAAHIYRTHDGGKTWKEIVEGIPDGNVVNSVREDPVRKGLLYAGTERAVFVSFDDGDHWQSLRLNMPATSIRDLVVHEDDLVVGTHGRSFWILDDVTALRQIDQRVASSDAFLFKPEVAYRIRRSVNTDTPIPPEEPMGQNPPDGAIIDYWLKSDASRVTLEILDAKGELVRKYSNSDPPEQVDPKRFPYPSYWFRPPRTLAAGAGMQRWVWDLHYPPLPGPRTFEIAAIYHDTPTSPLGPSALPGEYTVKLTVNGTRFTQPLTLRMDPRVVTPADGIAKMFEISHGSYEIVNKARAAQANIRDLRTQLQAIRQRAGQGQVAGAIAAFDAKLAAIAGPAAGGRRPRRGASRPSTETSFGSVANTATGVMSEVEAADALPTEAASKNYEQTSQSFDDLSAQWVQVQQEDLAELNSQLKAAGLPAVTPPVQN